MDRNVFTHLLVLLATYSHNLGLEPAWLHGDSMRTLEPALGAGSFSMTLKWGGKWGVTLCIRSALHGPCLEGASTKCDPRVSRSEDLNLSGWGESASLLPRAEFHAQSCLIHIAKFKKLSRYFKTCETFQVFRKPFQILPHSQGCIPCRVRSLPPAWGAHCRYQPEEFVCAAICKQGRDMARFEFGEENTTMGFKEWVKDY